MNKNFTTVYSIWILGFWTYAYLLHLCSYSIIWALSRNGTMYLTFVAETYLVINSIYSSLGVTGGVERVLDSITECLGFNSHFWPCVEVSSNVHLAVMGIFWGDKS